ncbi:MAG: GDSL family lipase, partial [Oscillospiraceae bacterium]|nr:GDSL family lipase [Oscillospiraceae bacterium]
VMEPFVLPTPHDSVLWREDLDPKIHAVRRLAREYADEFIPLDGIMAAAAAVSCPEQWAADGVHPTSDGAALIAKHWLEAFKRIISR